MEAGKFYLIKTDTGGALTGLRVHCLAVYRTHVSLYQMGMHYFVTLSSLTYSELKMPEVGKHYHINGIIDGVTRHDVALCVEHIRDMEFKLVFPGGRSFSVDVSDLTFIEVRPVKTTEPEKIMINKYTDLEPNKKVKTNYDEYIIRIGDSNVMLHANYLYETPDDPDIFMFPWRMERTYMYNDKPIKGMPMWMHVMDGLMMPTSCGGRIIYLNSDDEVMDNTTVLMIPRDSDIETSPLANIATEVITFAIDGQNYDVAIIRTEKQESVDLKDFFTQR